MAGGGLNAFTCTPCLVQPSSACCVFRGSSSILLLFFSAAATYAEKLHMRVVSLTASSGLVLELLPRCDARLLALTRGAAKPARAGPRVFCVDTPAGGHVLRQAARLQALSSIPASRLDREGLEHLDLEASSHLVWTRWLNTLSHDQLALLNIFRSGAIWTPTRRHAFFP